MPQRPAQGKFGICKDRAAGAAPRRLVGAGRRRCRQCRKRSLLPVLDLPAHQDGAWRPARRAPASPAAAVETRATRRDDRGGLHCQARADDGGGRVADGGGRVRSTNAVGHRVKPAGLPAAAAGFDPPPTCSGAVGRRCSVGSYPRRGRLSWRCRARRAAA